MIWIALVLSSGVFAHWFVRHRGEWKPFWFNVGLTTTTIAMSAAVSSHTWDQLQVLRMWYEVFVHISHALYNLM